MGFRIACLELFLRPLDVVKRKRAVLLGQLRPADIAESKALRLACGGNRSERAAGIDVARWRDRFYSCSPAGVNASVQGRTRNRVTTDVYRAAVQADSHARVCRQAERRPVAPGDEFTEFEGVMPCRMRVAEHHVHSIAGRFDVIGGVPGALVVGGDRADIMLEEQRYLFFQQS